MVDSICNVFITDKKGTKQVESQVPSSGYCTDSGGVGCFLDTSEGGSLTDGSVVLSSPSVQTWLESVNFTATGKMH